MSVRIMSIVVAPILAAVAAWSGVQLLILANFAIGNPMYPTCGWISGSCNPEITWAANWLIPITAVCLLGTVLSVFLAASPKHMQHRARVSYAAR